MPQGLALYVRRISQSRQGTPKQFAKKCADHGLGWIALAGLWQERRSNGKISSRMINNPDTLKRYGDALEAKGVQVYVWGYPWQGEEQQFADKMIDAATHRRVLLDPELGSNPTRSRKGAGKAKADEHARTLVQYMAGGTLTHLWLSTFGGGWRIGWFPLLAFTKALVRHFGGRTFIGGQTYTDNAVIDRSIADMQDAIVASGGEVPSSDFIPGATDVEVVPNFGTYIWRRNGVRGKRRPGSKAVSKTAEELRLHLHEFIDDDEPVDSMIGWAENFMTEATWNELSRFAALMDRGASRLPRGRK